MKKYKFTPEVFDSADSGGISQCKFCDASKITSLALCVKAEEVPGQLPSSDTPVTPGLDTDSFSIAPPSS